MLAIGDISNKLTFDLLTLKVVSESRVTWATSVPILVIGLSVLELRPTYATDVRYTSDKSIADCHGRRKRGYAGDLTPQLFM